MKEIIVTVSDETYYKLIKIGKENTKSISTIIDEMIVETTKTPRANQIRQMINSIKRKS